MPDVVCAWPFVLFSAIKYVVHFHFLQAAKEWGFVYSIVGSQLRLHRRPIVLGELLGADDLIDFVNTNPTTSARNGSKTTTSATAATTTTTSCGLGPSPPPAVRRILNRYRSSYRMRLCCFFVELLLLFLVLKTVFSGDTHGQLGIWCCARFGI